VLALRTLSLGARMAPGSRCASSRAPVLPSVTFCSSENIGTRFAVAVALSGCKVCYNSLFAHHDRTLKQLDLVRRSVNPPAGETRVPAVRQVHRLPAPLLRFRKVPHGFLAASTLRTRYTRACPCARVLACHRNCLPTCQTNLPLLTWTRHAGFRWWRLSDLSSCAATSSVFRSPSSSLS
jgi:hypothetical protein